jgi:hypothetical protein
MLYVVRCVVYSTDLERGSWHRDQLISLKFFVRHSVILLLEAMYNLTPAVQPIACRYTDGGILTSRTFVKLYCDVLE